MACILLFPYGIVQVNLVIVRKSINIYDELLRKTDDKDYHIYKACCYYALCLYDDARRQALKGGETPLQTRLLFHLAHKKND